MQDPQSRQQILDQEFPDGQYQNQSQSIQSLDNPQYRTSFDPNQPASRPSGYEPQPKNREYALLLQEQIRQKQEQKYREIKEEREKDLQALRARLDNDPFGKQGAGAPLRDRYGNIITNKTKAIHQLYDYPNKNGSGAGPEPVYSLKARLARENIVSQSLDSLPRGFAQNMSSQIDVPSFNPQGGFPPQQPGAMNPYYPPAYPYPYPYAYPPLPYGYPPGFPPHGERSNSQEAEMPMTAYSGNQRPNRASYELDGFGGRGRTSVPFLPGVDKGSEIEAKQKRIQTYQAHQNVLVQQMEEKQRKKEAEEARKKLEDELEEERIRRENEEMRQRDQFEAQKKKKAFQDFQSENKKLMDGFQNSGVVVLDTKKGKGKTVTIEEKVDVNEHPEIANLPVLDFPNEVGKKLQASIENQLSHVKKDWDMQQMFLQEQLIELKRQLLEANRERVDAQHEIGDLKNHLRSQQIAEEIRRTELYNALLKGQANLQTPSILPTVTRFEDETRSDMPFEFPRLGPGNRNLYRKNDDDGDALDAMLAGQSKIIDPNAKIGTRGRLVERVNSRPNSTGLDSSSFGVNYLNYFNTSDDRAGIKLDDNTGRFNLPDELSGTKNMNYEDTGTGNDVYRELLRKNKERLDVLEDLEYKEFGDGENFEKQFAKRPPGTIDDEIYQMLKAESIEDNLLNQINNPRKYNEL